MNLMISNKEKEMKEQIKSEQMKNKVYEQKALRDQQLLEAKNKKTFDA